MITRIAIISGIVVFTLFAPALLSAIDAEPKLEDSRSPQEPVNLERTVMPLVEALDKRIDDIEVDLVRTQVSKDFFSSVLNTQTMIFSTIVVVLIAISWVFSYLRVRSQVEVKFLEEKKAFDEWKNDLQKVFSAYLAEQIKDIREKARDLEAGLYRGYAQTHKESPSVSFIWWLRAAALFSDADLTHICLEGAVDAIKKLNKKYQIESTLNEAREHIASIEQDKFSLELSTIRSEIERIYHEKENQ